MLYFKENKYFCYQVSLSRIVSISLSFENFFFFLSLGSKGYWNRMEKRQDQPNSKGCNSSAADNTAKANYPINQPNYLHFVKARVYK